MEKGVPTINEFLDTMCKSIHSPFDESFEKEMMDKIHDIDKNKKPIEEFEDEEEFLQYAKWWQHKLFLDDWFIKYVLVESIDDSEKEENVEEVDGDCAFDFANRCAKIRIVNKAFISEETNTKVIAELVLIHELLHLKNEYISATEIFNTGEDYTTEKNQLSFYIHQWLEQMSKSLLMVKYNLDYNYFMEDIECEKKDKSEETT